MKIKCYIFILIAIMVLPCHAATQNIQRANQVGEITDYTGKVMVRTNGRWAELAEVPYPIYTSDKVVTQRGRAKIDLSDGGFLKLDTDTNICLSRKREVSGTLFFRKDIISRRINLLVGKIWFELKVKDKINTMFKTPSMTVKMTNADGGLQVNSNGSTKYGVIAGTEDEISGDFKHFEHSEKIEIPADISALKLPDTEASQSPLQEMASKAGEMRAEALKNVEKASELIENSQNTKETANAWIAYGDAFVTQIAATISAMEEIKEDARRFNDNTKLSMTESTLQNAQDTLNEAKVFGLICKRHVEMMEQATTEESLRATAYVIKAYASLMEISWRKVRADANVIEITISDNDDEAVMAARKAANAAELHVKKAKLAAQKVAEHASVSADEKTGEAQMMAAHAQCMVVSAHVSGADLDANAAELISFVYAEEIRDILEHSAKADAYAEEAFIAANHASEKANQLEEISGVNEIEFETGEVEKALSKAEVMQETGFVLKEASPEINADIFEMLDPLPPIDDTMMASPI